MPGRQRHAERVPQPAGVLDRRPALLAGDPDLDQPALRRQLGQPARRGPGSAQRSATSTADSGPIARSMSATPSASRQAPAGREPLQVALGILDDLRVEQLPQVGLAEQLGEQRRVQGQRLRPALGQRCVALVHERADVAEQQRPGERRRGAGLDLDQPDPARRPGRASGRSGRARRTRPAGTRAPSRARSGRSPYSLATASSWAERWRCCHSGVRRPGCRRGSSSARAAHSRNRDANSADAPSSAVTSCSTSSGSSSAIPAGGGSSASGTRITMPSSVCIACTSMPPYRSRSRAAIASAQGACTCAPYGLCRTSRQSPSSSRNRSRTRVLSSGR